MDCSLADILLGSVKVHNRDSKSFSLSIQPLAAFASYRRRGFEGHKTEKEG